MALLVAGCGPAAAPPLPSATVPAAGETEIPATATIPPATPTRSLPIATVSPAPATDAATSPLPTPGAAREALQLVVLHSNDNWGETEPCG